jgi:hypothetical protein
MKNLKSIVGSTMLVVALSAPAHAKTGVISTTKTGVISTTKTGVISTTKTGVISTTRTGTTATARSNSTDSFDQSWLLQLLFTFFNPW